MKRKLLIFVLSGKIVHSAKNSDNSIDISQLADGMYTLRITDNQSTTIKKFVKQP